MRIALFTETYVPDVNGVVAHVKTLKQGLEKQGHEVLVVCADKRTKRHYVKDGVLHCPATESKRLYGFGVAQPISRRRMNIIAEFKPDIMHIHHEFGIGLTGILAAKMQHKPLVYTLHTMYDQYIYYIAPRFLHKAATKVSHQYERFIARNATELTGPSQKCSEYFKKIGIHKEFNLIPNSADLDMFDPQKVQEDKKAEIREKYNIPADKMIACFVGRLGQEKSVDVLLEFWKKSIVPEDGLHLLIVGDGPDRKALELLAETLGIAEMVTFTGLISHNEMPAYFCCCDAFVSASLSEMNSISMLESMATGLVVLQRYDELNADQIKQGENGYLYHTAEEMGTLLKAIRALSLEELAAKKQAVIHTVTARGGVELAGYMLTVYQKAQQATKPKRPFRLRPMRKIK